MLYNTCVCCLHTIPQDSAILPIERRKKHSIDYVGEMLSLIYQLAKQTFSHINQMNTNEGVLNM